ncbi:LysR family transcriptional regulator [Roseibium salinum]|uniref:LysR family transcriptional regulator n=1 Tax=Roseibium salinum TaxID=1604349 RepID=A0ABT3R6G0_9HYPH|nr:LysR family transcriptional regulator [Roseibium sp. DSM 29163]MCX2724690.1 LysR family transcriptional regulator [Roseibium sp. DSM 29163]
MINLPPLSSIRAFEAASRHLSFTRAGEELGMTQAAVSYQIKLLEERLGFALFTRKARKIELTDHGAQLAAKVVDAFSSLRSAFEDVTDQNARQLVVSSNTTFAVNWLANRLVHFQMQNPDIAVRILPYGPDLEPAICRCRRCGLGLQGTAKGLDRLQNRQGGVFANAEPYARRDR